MLILWRTLFLKGHLNNETSLIVHLVLLRSVSQLVLCPGTGLMTGCKHLQYCMLLRMFLQEYLQVSANKQEKCINSYRGIDCQWLIIENAVAGSMNKQ